jgi:hypothetical protein
MVGYAPEVTLAESTDTGTSKIALELVGDQHAAAILVAWLRTVPGVEAAKII